MRRYNFAVLAVFVQGFLLNAGLIVAIGAQNAFVIAQGLRRRNVFWAATACSVCDTLLICAGLLLAGFAGAGGGGFVFALTFAGILFLLWFGARALRSAWRGESLAAEDDGNGDGGDGDGNNGNGGDGDNGKSKNRKSKNGAGRIVLAACAFSLLNPHAILDMTVIFGGAAAALAEPLRLPFAAGGAAASLAWFFALGYGAGKMSPLLAKAAVWRAIHCAVAAVMFAAAFALAFDLLK